MWASASVIVFLLCLKPYLGQPQYDLDNLGSRISADVRQRLAPLDNLGAEIEADVHRSLLPVYAMSIRNDMAQGIGGTTIATHSGKKTQTFIIQNGNRNVCKGTITGSQCDGTLEPFQISSKEDHCYASSYAVINNDICLSSGPVNVFVNNNHFTCRSNNNLPTLILTLQELDDLCGDASSRRILYKYYANPRDPRAIPIPNANPYVKCLNNEPGVCEFEGENIGPIRSNGNNIVFNNGYVVSSSGSNFIYNN